MKINYYAKKMIKGPQPLYGITLDLSSMPMNYVFEVPDHPLADKISKFRIVPVNGHEVLIGLYEIGPCEGQYEWREIAIAKDRTMLKIWKDLHYAKDKPQI